MKWYSHLGKQSGSSSYLTGYNPVVLLLGVYPREMKPVHAKLVHKWVIIALFIIVKSGNNPKFPSTGDWISKI